MNSFTHTSRRRKFVVDDVSDIYCEPHKKVPRITIDEKDLSAEADMDAVHMAPVSSQFAAFPQNAVASTPVMQSHHYAPVSLSYFGGRCTQEKMDFAVDSAPPNFVAQNSVPRVCGYEHENRINHLTAELQQGIMMSQQCQQPSLRSQAQGSCLQCLSGESGHIHHIMSRIQSAGQQ